MGEMFWKLGIIISDGEEEEDHELHDHDGQQAGRGRVRQGVRGRAGPHQAEGGHQGAGEEVG